MTPFEGAVLALFLAIFGPLAFLYGRSLAHRVHAQARRHGGSAFRIMAAKLVVPALVALSMTVCFSLDDPGDGLGAVASGTLRTMVSVLWFAGLVFGFLFFVTIPFVFGRCFAFIAVALGWFQHLDRRPTRSGTAGFRERAARAEPEDDEV